jgi:PilZ domain
MDNTEKRQSTRRPITHSVFMATGLGPPLKCQMLDISELGARIRVGDPKTAPQEFLIVLDRGLARWCQVVWRSKTEIGIKFIEPPQSLKTEEKAEEE